MTFLEQDSERSRKNDPLTTYLAEHPLEDILTGNTESQGLNKSNSKLNAGACGKEEHCSCFLKQSQTIQTLETQVKTAAELGQALLVRHQDYISSAEEEKACLLSELSQAKERLHLADAEHQKVQGNNTQLVKQLSIVSDSLFVSEAKVEQLTRTLQDQHSQLVKVNNCASRAESLESQVSILESARDTLQQELHIAARDKRLAEARWRKTERMLEKLTVQYQKLEQEASGNNEMTSQHLKSEDNEPATPIQTFIQGLLAENSALETNVMGLQEQLSASKEEIRDLRQQLVINSRSSHGDLSDGQKEVHHHHHFHVLPPNFQSRNPTTPKLRSKQVSIPPTYFISGIPTPPDPADKIRPVHSSQHYSHEINGPEYSRHRRTHSLPDAQDDDSDTCTGDDANSGEYYFDNHSIYGLDKSTVRKFISHESGLRGLEQNDISMVDPVLYSNYPGSPNLVIEENDDMGLIYSPMPKLHRSTSHDSIFSGLDVNSQIQAPNSPQLSAPFMPSVTSTTYLSIPEIDSSHRPSLYGTIGTSSKSEVANVSAEFTFSATQQPNKLRSKMLLSAAVANSARRKSSLASFRSSSTLAGSPSSMSSVASATSSLSTMPLNSKWSTFFTKLRGGSSSEAQEPQLPSEASLKPPTAPLPSSPRSAVSTPTIPNNVFASPLSNTYSSSSSYMSGLSTALSSNHRSNGSLATLKASASVSSLKPSVEEFLDYIPHTYITNATTHTISAPPTTSTAKQNLLTGPKSTVTTAVSTTGPFNENHLAEALHDTF